MITLATSPAVAEERPVRDRSQEVLDAAVDIFARRGYRATSMRDLAEAVGLSKPAIYHYVRSKEELLVTLYRRVVEEGIESAREIVSTQQEPMAALRAVLADRVRYTCENRRLLRIFFEEESELPAELMETVREQRRRYEDALIELLVRATQTGAARLDSSPRVTVNTLLGAANWTYKWFDPQGPLTAEELAETMADLMMRLVAPVPQRLPSG